MVRKRLDIIDLLSDYCEIPYHSITNQSHLYCDLGLTEDDIKFNLIPEIEDYIGKGIPDYEIPNIKTVKDLSDYLDK